MLKEEIENMKNEADLYAEKDKKKRELIEARNLADNLIYTWEKTVRDAGDKIDKGLKKEIEGKVEALKKAKDSDNIEEIKNKTTELSQTIQKAGTEIYKKTQTEGKSKDEKGKDAEEGEFKEKKL